MDLNINFNDPSSLENKQLINNTVEYIMPRALFPEGELSISFITSEEMKELNEKYRNKQEPTDVLTFPMFEDELIGDIYICLEQVNLKARTHKIDKNEQLIMTIAHAFAHLLGYDHNNDEEREIMEDFEDFLLKRYIAI
jgi:probable rRNA maturation factor